MTVNKFGNYLHYKTEDHRLSMTADVSTVKPSSNLSFKSVCVVSLRGTSSLDTLKYTLENGKKSYEFKITGKIEHIDVSTDVAKIVLNDGDLVSPNSLIGTTINKGDILQIFENRPIGRSERVYIEFILLCPVIKDE